MKDYGALDFNLFDEYIDFLSNTEDETMTTSRSVQELVEEAELLHKARIQEQARWEAAKYRLVQEAKAAKAERRRRNPFLETIKDDPLGFIMFVGIAGFLVGIVVG